MFGTADLRQRAASHSLTCFFRSWVQDPFRVGAVAPSSRGLARLMAARLGPGSTVVELGPGTGTVTQAILASGVHPDDLHLVERSGAFAAFLRQRFPALNVVCGDALSVDQQLADLAGTVDCIVSGLPLLLFSRPQRAQLLSSAFTLLAPGGCFHQFTYGGRSPISRALLVSLGLRACRIGVTPFNIPPAFVYRFERALA